MRLAQHPKQALDAFWLACTPSTENARSLLNTYYGRVEEANASFSGLVEGWRSDRGMVHIVFGVPQRIRSDTWNEYWTYGEEGTANALSTSLWRLQPGSGRRAASCGLVPSTPQRGAAGEAGDVGSWLFSK